MKKILWMLLPLAACTACSDDDFSAASMKPAEVSEVFDFNMTKDVHFAADFGKMASGSLVQVFLDNPTRAFYNTDNSIAYYGVDGNAVFNSIANSMGCVEANLRIPSYQDSIWVTLHALSVGITQAYPVKNGRVVVEEDALGLKNRTRAASITRSPGTTGVTDLQMLDIPSTCLRGSGVTNLKSLVKWWDANGNGDVYGTVLEDPNGVRHDDAYLVSSGKFDANDLVNLQHKLWRNTYKQSGNYNNSYLASPNAAIVNTVVHDGVDENGNPIDKTKLWFHFLDEAAWNQNVMAYYVYPTGETPNVANLEKYIIIPNASKPNHYPFDKNNAGAFKNAPDKGPAKPFHSVQLLFKDPDTGVVSADFPAGYTVGFLCLSDAFGHKTSPTSYVGQINKGATALYSNCDFNQNSTSRYFSLSMTSKGTEYTIYGLEDATDNSYEDILFIIEAEYPTAVHTPERPLLEDIPEISSGNTMETSQYATYGFEDKWDPGNNARDYDMNDLVLTHSRTYTHKLDSKNTVTKVTDEFIVVNQEANQDNAFCFQILQKYSDQNGVNMTWEVCKDGKNWQPWQKLNQYNWKGKGGKDWRTYIVFATKTHGVKSNWKFRVTRDITTSPSLSAFESEELTQNPFLIPEWNVHSQSSPLKFPEIHLPKEEVSPLALNSEKDSQYFVDTKHSDGMQYPWAINIPELQFTPSPEGIRIDQTYERFKPWVISNGNQHKDWYKIY